MRKPEGTPFRLSVESARAIRRIPRALAKTAARTGATGRFEDLLVAVGTTMFKPSAAPRRNTVTRSLRLDGEGASVAERASRIPLLIYIPLLDVGVIL
jgi:hypothetical protein